MRTPWLIDNPDVRCWYYRDAPTPGDTIAYMSESYIDTVKKVTLISIWFESGHAMRRPYLFARLITWITAKLTEPRPKYARTGITVTVPRHRPDMTILPV